jgi:hypothetical protein
MSPQLDALDVAPQGEENGGSLGSIGVGFPVRGGGHGLRNGLFPQLGCDNLVKVGVPRRRHKVGLERKRMGLGLLAQGPGCGVTRPSE